jgi:hypothetical protein
MLGEIERDIDGLRDKLILCEMEDEIEGDKLGLTEGDTERLRDGE